MLHSVEDRQRLRTARSTTKSGNRYRHCPQDTGKFLTVQIHCFLKLFSRCRRLSLAEFLSSVLFQRILVFSRLWFECSGHIFLFVDYHVQAVTDYLLIHVIFALSETIVGVRLRFNFLTAHAFLAGV